MLKCSLLLFILPFSPNSRTRCIRASSVCLAASMCWKRCSSRCMASCRLRSYTSCRHACLQLARYVQGAVATKTVYDSSTRVCTLLYGALCSYQPARPALASPYATVSNDAEHVPLRHDSFTVSLYKRAVQWALSLLQYTEHLQYHTGVADTAIVLVRRFEIANETLTCCFLSSCCFCSRISAAASRWKRLHSAA